MNASTIRNVTAGALLVAVGVWAGLLVAAWRLPSAAGDGHGAASAAARAAAAASAQRRVLYWYDPMVPGQKFDKPGKSPFMDMQLVPRYADEGDAGAAPAVAVSPQAVQSLGLRVATVERRALASAIDVPGTVGLNERDVSVLQARAGGFVERVYARAPGDVIAAGAPLADLLHPDWLSAQREYLAVRATGDAVLAQAARARLALLGMPPALVERVDASGQPEAVTTVTAPAGGLVSELMVRQGMTVAAGMTLARINGLSSVWVEAALPEAQAAVVAVGQRVEVQVPAFPGERWRGRVTAILPEASRETRTLRVRIELPNPGLRLRAGQFVQVALQGAAARPALAVPAEAVIRTGRRALVYVLDAPGRYRPQAVELGAEVDGHIAVLSGLQEGQQVVASGPFLIDSEASLQGLATTPEAAAPASSAAGGEHETVGRVTELEPGSVTLEHEAVPALKWPAMTMPFALARPELARTLKPGDRVRLRFRVQGSDALITALQPLPPAAHASGARP